MEIQIRAWHHVVRCGATAPAIGPHSLLRSRLGRAGRIQTGVTWAGCASSSTGEETQDLGSPTPCATNDHGDQVTSPKGRVTALPLKSPVDRLRRPRRWGTATIECTRQQYRLPWTRVWKKRDTVKVFTSKAAQPVPHATGSPSSGPPRARNRSAPGSPGASRGNHRGKGAIARTQTPPAAPHEPTRPSLNVAKTLDKVDIDGLYAAVGEDTCRPARHQ